MRILIVVPFLIGAASVAAGQAVGDRRFDPATGDYFVTVMNDERQLVEMRVVPPNKVLVSVAVAVERGMLDPFRYVYRVRVHEGTRQPLAFFDVDCPASVVIRNLTAIATQNGVATPWNAHQITATEPPRCDIIYRGTHLEAGGALEVGLESTLLPGIGEVRAFGATPGVNWPTFDPIEENYPAEPVVRRLSGHDGGWKSVSAAVPGRDPATVTSPGMGVSLLQSDLGRACGDLAWITSAGVCHSLQVKLDEAGSSLQRGDPQSARGQLQAFLNELRAQHGPEPGKHVTDNAYWLLTVNAEFLLTKL